MAKFRFFLMKEPVGNIIISCERQATNLYSVEVKSSRILIPNPMEKELKEVVAKYINGIGYDNKP